MYIKNLQLINFKNFSNQTIEFSEKINCFTGDNGAGKTNLLDAIYYLSFTKSYFNNSDILTIKHDENFFALHGEFITKLHQISDRVSCSLMLGKKKSFKKNDKEYDRFSDHIGSFPCVMVSPYDKDIIREGSSQRRKFVDIVISQFDIEYLDNLIRYNQLLKQRNTLLKQISDNESKDFFLLDMLDEQIEKPCSFIFEKRKIFIEGFLPLFIKYFDKISQGKEKVNIEYQSHLHDKSYTELAKKSLERDLFLKFSCKGIHKDDFAFFISGHTVKNIASQGQQKSFALALKLAQFEYTSEVIKFKPILLLDDIFDKLDAKRVEQIVNLVLNENFGQVFITDTETYRLKNILNNINQSYKLYHVSNAITKLIEEK